MSFQPRKYQQEAIDAVLCAFAAGKRSVLVVMATGTGKTIVSAHVAKAMLDHGRVMALAHRDELIRQAAAKWQDVTGIIPSIEKGDEWADEDSMHGASPVLISSIQTQCSGKDRKRMQRFVPADFSLIWLDEAHHGISATNQAVLNYYRDGNPNLKVLLVTATADRADGESLGQICDEVVYRYELPDAIRDGYLVPVKQNRVRIADLDFSKCRTTAGDLNAGDLEAIMLMEKPLHGVAHATIEAACGLERGSIARLKDDEQRTAKILELIGGNRRRKTLIFTASVSHAERLAEILNRWLPESAEHVDGSMSMERRREIFKRFHDGRTQYLVNCAIAAEGFDEPGIELVSMAKPTKSRPLYAQMAGRGTRPLESIAHHLGGMEDSATRVLAIQQSEKPCVEILDFVGNSGKHKLISAVEIVCIGKDEAVIERAEELAEDGAIGVDEAVEIAEAEIEEERELEKVRGELAAEEIAKAEELAEIRRQAEIARRLGIVAAADYSVEEVDGFDAYATAPDESSAISRAGPSDKQIAALKKMRVSEAEARSYSKKQAGVVLESLRRKRCSTGQEWRLKSIGYRQEQIDTMNYYQAHEAINQSQKVSAA